MMTVRKKAVCCHRGHVDVDSLCSHLRPCIFKVHAATKAMFRSVVLLQLGAVFMSVATTEGH